MLVPSGPNKQQVSWAALILITLGALILFSGSVVGQVTDEEIERLKKQGEQEGWTFEVGHNDATKYSIDQLCGLKEPPDWRENAKFEPFLSASTTELPESYDWREHDGVTPIRNQGNCGSCWAFATVGALECNIKIVDGVTEDLSEQYLVSCNSLGYDCGGGWWVHSYHMDATDPCGDSGAVMEAEFPYAADDLPCGCPYEHRYFIEDWGYVGQEWTIPTVEAMKQAILNYGPISVAVYVNSAFQAYNGGVFNFCSDQPINHAVVLVGWDDNLGTNGCWIMRNSWGTNWGDDGYMYIEYGCSRIGYNASYIVYGGGIRIEADTTYGHVPLDVDFVAYTGLEADSWAWQFGDGDGASVQDPPVHTYDAVGVYDVSVEITAGGDVRSNTRENYIVVYADTIKAPGTGGNPDTQVEMVVNANNTAPVRYLKLPVEFPSDYGLMLDSFSTAGCRTAYFEVQEYLHYDPWFGRRVTLKLISSNNETSPDLPAGSGPVVKLYFTIPGTATIGQSSVVTFDGYDSYLPEYQGPYASYSPETIDVLVSVSESCCANRGDIDHNGQIDALDISYFVEWLWKGGAAAPCEEETDLDASGQVDALDLTYLVAYMWESGPPPAGCF